jgi:hypothetical protein
LIISHKYKFIFFAVPRTATHSIRHALGPCLTPDDWQQELLRKKQTIPIAGIARLGHGHISVSQLKQNVSKDIWSTYFKFAFVRNPYDRFASVCSFLNKNNVNYATYAPEFMKNALLIERFKQRILVRPQTEMLLDEVGVMAMDFIGRYETLQGSWDHICNAIGIKPQALQRQNQSSQTPTSTRYRNYYDHKLEAQVRDFYLADFAMLDYQTSLFMQDQ